MAKYYVEFNMCEGYYIEAENQDEAIEKAEPFFYQCTPEIIVDYATEEEIEDEYFY